MSPADELHLMIEIGSKLRQLQKEYFKTRDRGTLLKCKEIEKEFDTLLEVHRRNEQ